MLVPHEHVGELTLHHSCITLQINNTLGFPQASPRKPHGSSGFSLLVIAMDTGLDGMRARGQKTEILERERNFPKTHQNEERKIQMSNHCAVLIKRKIKCQLYLKIKNS